MKRATTFFISLLIIVFLPINIDAITYSNDTYSTKSWYHRCLNTQEAWDLIDSKVGNTHDKIVVASIDTGAYFNLKDFGPNIDEHNSVNVFNGNITEYQTPKFSHGTFLANIIASTSNNGIGVAGVAAGNKNNLISYISVNVAHENYNTYTSIRHHFKNTTTDDIICGINYAIEKKARIIQLCLGHNETFLDANKKHFNVSKLKTTLKTIQKNHPEVIFIASAGNQNSTHNWYPSDCSNVISFINTRHFTNIYKKNVKAKTSNYGKNKNLSAPGCAYSCNKEQLTVDKATTTNLSTKNSPYHITNSTSACSSVATGVAALVAYANPNLSGNEIYEIMKDTAIDLYKPGYDIYTCYGNINAYNAVAKALRLAGYSGFPDKINVPKGPSRPKKIYITKSNKNKIQIKWTKCKSTNNYINQYRIYISRKKNGKYKKIATVPSKKNKIYYKVPQKNCTYYIKIKPYGTTSDGKKLLPKNNGKKDAKKFKFED